jgi:hypothetical protein
MLIDRESALRWSLEEVLERWTQLFSGPLLVTRYLSDARGQMTGAEIAKVRELGEAYRIGIDPERFIGYSEHMLKAFGTAVGAPAAMANLCVRRQTKYLRGIKAARQIFKAPRAA